MCKTCPNCGWIGGNSGCDTCRPAVSGPPQTDALIAAKEENDTFLDWVADMEHHAPKLDRENAELKRIMIESIAERNVRLAAVKRERDDLRAENARLAKVLSDLTATRDLDG